MIQLYKYHQRELLRLNTRSLQTHLRLLSKYDITLPVLCYPSLKKMTRPLSCPLPSPPLPSPLISYSSLYWLTPRIGRCLHSFESLGICTFSRDETRSTWRSKTAMPSSRRGHQLEVVANGTKKREYPSPFRQEVPSICLQHIYPNNTVPKTNYFDESFGPTAPFCCSASPLFACAALSARIPGAVLRSPGASKSHSLGSTLAWSTWRPSDRRVRRSGRTLSAEPRTGPTTG